MSDVTTYATRDEAIEFEVIMVLNECGGGAGEYDIEAIATEVLTTTGEGTGYRWVLNPEADFWDSVRRART